MPSLPRLLSPSFPPTPLPPYFPFLCFLSSLPRWYLPLSALCLASTTNAVNLTDGLDGLAAGTCAIAFVAMAVAVLPIYPGEDGSVAQCNNTKESIQPL